MLTSEIVNFKQKKNGHIFIVHLINTSHCHKKKSSSIFVEYILP